MLFYSRAPNNRTCPIINFNKMCSPGWPLLSCLKFCFLVTMNDICLLISFESIIVLYICLIWIKLALDTFSFNLNVSSYRLCFYYDSRRYREGGLEEFKFLMGGGRISTSEISIIECGTFAEMLWYKMSTIHKRHQKSVDRQKQV